MFHLAQNRYTDQVLRWPGLKDIEQNAVVLSCFGCLFLRFNEDCRVLIADRHDIPLNVDQLASQCLPLISDEWDMSVEPASSLPPTSAIADEMIRAVMATNPIEFFISNFLGCKGLY
jgi:hypothetical protein